MPFLKSIKSKISMIKEIFSQKAKIDANYFDEINKEIVTLKEHLIHIDRKYANENQVDMPNNIKFQREEILRKLDIYCRQVERESDRNSIFYRIWWSWLLR